MHNGVNHVEFELLDSGGVRVSLAASNVQYIKKNGINLVLDSNETLWFSESNLAGDYSFEIFTKDGKLYIATLNWIPTP
ncbi:hypothetical protein SAMN02799630_02795 [Paenibacillus sp. UNCCL117]|nr:hypothetical protein SAMN04488602_107117 [Paenibacillus sp. cl123]SFW40591.1 hypothetical protein SAMN02799630_02795 [Paenibacillus sp. UNCCL117]